MVFVNAVFSFSLLLAIIFTFCIIAGIDGRGLSSMLLGFLVANTGYRIFAYYAFKHKGAKNANKILYSFLKGEALKLIFFAGATVTVIKVFKIEPMPYVLGVIIFVFISTFMNMKKR